MARCYADTHKRTFSLSDFQTLCPELDKEFISDALSLLKDDGFVSVFYADGVAYMIELLPSAIRDAEKNTLLKKTYTVLKEIRSWL